MQLYSSLKDDAEGHPTLIDLYSFNATLAKKDDALIVLVLICLRSYFQAGIPTFYVSCSTPSLIAPTEIQSVQRLLDLDLFFVRLPQP